MRSNENKSFLCALPALLITGTAGWANAEVFSNTGFVQSETYVETFDDGQNHSDWTYGRNREIGFVANSGGNPGGFYSSDQFIFSAFGLHSTDSRFTGNYRSREVSTLGADFFSQTGSPLDNFLSVILYNHGETSSLDDDTAAIFVSTVATPMGAIDGWVGVDFLIDYSSVDTPTGWFLTGAFPEDDPTTTWDHLIQNVDEVIFSWSDPRFAVPIFDVERGFDNARVTYTVPSPASGMLFLSALTISSMRRQRTV